MSSNIAHLGINNSTRENVIMCNWIYTSVNIVSRARVHVYYTITLFSFAVGLRERESNCYAFLRDESITRLSSVFFMKLYD